MVAQAWITIAIFVLAIIFSIIMASISPAFRNNWELKNVWSYAIFFLSIVVAALILTMSAQCSVTGTEFGKYTICNTYAWILAILILAIFGIFMAHSIIQHVDEKKEAEKAVQANTSVVQAATVASTPTPTPTPTTAVVQETVDVAAEDMLV